ncbi:MAG: hypothetical protein C0617_06275 [Desulfuromonas sp.]|uniref:hypothetical protein n=1 Tax=Desulfuromonas sp. TaxID=892 RepID=UPI000CAAB4B9|nr:hypothetical protein [Desulfuromonas sp.]PLX84945.1 MAG: hypothetical protein C0617_06275 [Desulfuromonas sp.]
MLGNSSRNLILSDAVLALFSRRRNAARKLNRSFLADGCPRVKLSRGGKGASRALDPSLAKDALFDDRFLGGGAFVEQVLAGDDHDARQKRPSLCDLERLVAEDFQVPPAVLKRPSKERPIVRAKAVICYVAVRRLRIKGAMALLTIRIKIIEGLPGAC